MLIGQSKSLTRNAKSIPVFVRLHRGTVSVGWKLHRGGITFTGRCVHTGRFLHTACHQRGLVAMNLLAQLEILLGRSGSTICRNRSNVGYVCGSKHDFTPMLLLAISL